jgi:hypothetical protein
MRGPRRRPRRLKGRRRSRSKRSTRRPKCHESEGRWKWTATGTGTRTEWRLRDRNYLDLSYIEHVQIIGIWNQERKDGKGIEKEFGDQIFLQRGDFALHI